MGRAERKKLIETIEKARGSRVICYLTSDRPNADAQIKKDVIPLFYEHLLTFDDHSKVDVFLFTNGGDTIAGFGLAQLVREFASEVGLLVPRNCHSAGTLFAMGANEIVMTRIATLSPFDPSITGPLNPAVESQPGEVRLVPLSVESVAGFKDLVIDDWGIKGEKALSDAFDLLADKVHPLALGDVFRVRQQIALLATKLLQRHRTEREEIDRIVHTLTRELGSHDYLIARSEAKELLGNQIVEHQGLEEMIWDLFCDFQEEMQLGKAYDPGLELHAAAAAAGGTPPTPLHVKQVLAVVESMERGDSCDREIALLVQAQQGIAQQVVRAGWSKYD